MLKKMEPIDKLKTRQENKKYLDYLDLRKKGLKKQAQKVLIDFFKDFELQDKTVRRDFINDVYTLAFLSNDYSTYLPYNLVEQVLKPEIYRWIEDEPDNPVPYKWTYDFNLLQKSLQLNPIDQIALTLFANKLIGRISMNQHELSAGYPYNGNPKDDIYLIDAFEELINNIQNPEERNKIKMILSDLKTSALLYNDKKV